MEGLALGFEALLLLLLLRVVVWSLLVEGWVEGLLTLHLLLRAGRPRLLVEGLIQGLGTLVLRLEGRCGGC